MTQTDSISEKSINNNETPLDKVKIIGLGKAGVKIVSKLDRLDNTDWLRLAVVDSDKGTLSQSCLNNKFLIGEEWTRGLGCGGNVIKGERAIAHKSNSKLKEFLNNSSLLFIVSGFGRGTGTGGTPVIARLAKEKNIPTVIISTMPFGFEGHSKREIAERQINTLIRTKNNTVIPVPNDLLYTKIPSTSSFEEAFEQSNDHVSKAVLGLAELLKFNNLLSVDLCSLHNILYKQKTECGVGIGISESPEKTVRINEAINNLFESPLMGGQQRIKNSDALIVSITGGKDLSIGEVKHALEIISEQANPKAEIITGANTDEDFDEKIQITVIPIQLDKLAEPVMTSTNLLKTHLMTKQASKTSVIKGAEKLKQEVQQLELPFKSQSRGIFTNSSPTFYKGEDLDIPTFQRKDIHLDKGK